eukprot:674668-Rhodomonas_salina.1
MLQPSLSLSLTLSSFLLPPSSFLLPPSSFNARPGAEQQQGLLPRTGGLRPRALEGRPGASPPLAPLLTLLVLPRNAAVLFCKLPPSAWYSRNTRPTECLVLTYQDEHGA